MKILPSLEASRRSVGSSPKKESSKGKSFSKYIESSATDETLLDRLFADSDRVLENIFLLAEEMDRAGDELTEKPTPENFALYKKYVGLIMKGALRNMQVQERSVKRADRPAVYKTVQEIDEVLADLARRILGDEKTRLDLLKLTGHIKGLILSLLA